MAGRFPSRQSLVVYESSDGVYMIRLFLFIAFLIFNTNLYGAENYSGEKSNTAEHAPTRNTNKPKKTTENISPPIKKPISAIGRPIDTRQTDSDEKKEDERPNESWWFKFRTDPVATFTFILAVVTGFLWWSTRQLVLGAEKTAAQQLRAYIFTTHKEGINLEVNGELSTATQIKNFGQTPAHDMMTCHRVGIYKLPLTATNKLEEPTYEPGFPKGPLAPGEVAYQRATIPELLPKDIIADLEAGKAALFVFGEIRYSDIFNKPHRTSYCLFSTGEDFMDRSLAYYHEGNEAD